MRSSNLVFAWFQEPQGTVTASLDDILQDHHAKSLDQIWKRFWTLTLLPTQTSLHEPCSPAVSPAVLGILWMSLQSV